MYLKNGKRKNRTNGEVGRPKLSSKTGYTVGLTYIQSSFLDKFANDNGLSTTVVIESLVEMLRVNPESFVHFDNPHYKRKLKPLESASA